MPCMLQPDLVAFEGMHVPKSCSNKALRKRPPTDHSDVSITQAQLLFSRGDLKNRKTCFDLNLDKPTFCNDSGTRQIFERLGARVAKPTADMLGMLRVERVVDRVGNAASPVAKWNASQYHQPELMVKPGDLICTADTAFSRADTKVLKKKPERWLKSKSRSLTVNVERIEPTLFEPCSTFCAGHSLDIMMSMTERDCVASVYHDADAYEQFLAIAVSREPYLTDVEACSTKSTLTTETARMSSDEKGFSSCNSIIPKPRCISFSGGTSSGCEESPLGFVGRVLQGIRKKTARASDVKTRMFDDPSNFSYIELAF